MTVSILAWSVIAQWPRAASQLEYIAYVVPVEVWQLEAASVAGLAKQAVETIPAEAQRESRLSTLLALSSRTLKHNLMAPIQ
eukprot:5671061-Pyramimonas_sp.AAC.1